jgi:hypothetical protein
VGEASLDPRSLQLLSAHRNLQIWDCRQKFGKAHICVGRCRFEVLRILSPVWSLSGCNGRRRIGSAKGFLHSGFVLQLLAAGRGKGSDVMPLEPSDRNLGPFNLFTSRLAGRRAHFEGRKCKIHPSNTEPSYVLVLQLHSPSTVYVL